MNPLSLKRETRRAGLALAACFAAAPWLQPACAAPSGKAAPPRDAKTDRLLGNDLRIGFYLYLYSWKQWKDPAARDIEDQINRIADLGFNSLYLGGASENPAWERVLALCLKRKIAVIAQLDFAYLQLDSDVDALAARAVPFIQKYKDHPAVIAFSIKEEPASLEWPPLLHRYYQKIRDEVPDARLHLLEAILPVMKAQLPPYVASTGTDRYAFWWEFSRGNNRATPASALGWFRSQADAFYQVAEARKQSYEVVLTDWIQRIAFPPEKLKATIYPKEISEEDRQAAFDRYLRLARVGNQGLSEDGPEGTLQVWKYYRPPANCLSAMAWLAVMEGAQSLSLYPWGLPKKEFVWSQTKGTGYISAGTLGWEMQGTPSLAEYAAFAREMRPFGRLIRSMTKETTPLVKEPEGHEEAVNEPPVNPALEIRSKEAAWRSFTLPGYRGKVVIVVNTRVGSWCDGRSPVQLADEDRFRIDEQGNLIDYAPFYLPRTLDCRVLAPESEVVDLETGRKLPVSESGALDLSVLPGRGRLLFLNPAGTKESAKLLRQYVNKP